MHRSVRPLVSVLRHADPDAARSVYKVRLLSHHKSLKFTLLIQDEAIRPLFLVVYERSTTG